MRIAMSNGSACGCVRLLTPFEPERCRFVFRPQEGARWGKTFAGGQDRTGRACRRCLRVVRQTPLLLRRPEKHRRPRAPPPQAWRVRRPVARRVGLAEWLLAPPNGLATTPR